MKRSCSCTESVDEPASRQLWRFCGAYISPTNRNKGIIKSLPQKGPLSVDGDGSIALGSLGYACASPWRTRSQNPSSIPIKIREYKHQRKPMIEGGFQGVTEGEHVNIMGNVELIRDVLKVVTGNGDDVAERIASNLHSIGRKIDERKRTTKTTRRLGR